uniref:Uncharacterized protein n=1 Tax=Glossina austeni TaxID=7395 RepID=A0A1A9V5W1_GLOAU
MLQYLVHHQQYHPQKPKRTTNEITIYLTGNEAGKRKGSCRHRRRHRRCRCRCRHHRLVQQSGGLLSEWLYFVNIYALYSYCILTNHFHMLRTILGTTFTLEYAQQPAGAILLP